MTKTSGFCSAPRTLATDAESQVDRYDAEISEVKARLRAIEGIDSKDARELRARGTHAIAILERGRGIAAATAQHI